jgi:hypothetical protein
VKSGMWFPSIISLLLATVTFIVFEVIFTDWGFIEKTMVGTIVGSEVLAGILLTLSSTTKGARVSAAVGIIGTSGLAAFALLSLLIGVVFIFSDIGPAYYWVYIVTLILAATVVGNLLLSLAPLDVDRRHDLEAEAANKQMVRSIINALAGYRNLVNEAQSAQLLAATDIEDVIRRIRRIETKVEIMVQMRPNDTQQNLLGELGEGLSELQSAMGDQSIDTVPLSILTVRISLAKLEQLCLSYEGAK